MTSASAAHRQRRRLGLLLAAPAVVLMAMFILWPIVVSAQYSVTSASGFGDMRFAGLDNYARALGEADFYAAFGRNAIFAAVVMVSSVAAGFLLAYLLFIRVAGWRRLQVLLMLPYILPVVVTGLLWQFMMEPQNGLLNSGLRAIGLSDWASPWLSSPDTALMSTSLVQIWVMIPFAMLLIFGAMISIPREVIEAAEIDGAGHLGKMFRIVLPIVRPTMVLTSLVIAVTLFRSFDLVWVLTRGGPINATTISTLYVYVQGFVNNNYGYANAAGIVVGLVLVVIALVPRLVQRRAARRAEARR